MPRWAIALTVAPLVICLGCVAVAYLVIWRGIEEGVPELQDAVSADMAAVLSGYVSRRIEARALAVGGIGDVDEVVLRASDLTVNTIEVPSSAGIETGPDGTTVYGVETWIGPAGITLLFPGVTYSAVPIVESGRVEMTRVEDSGNMLGFLFPADVFEQVMEDGINDALRDHGLTPVSVVLRSGAMTIEVVPAACLGGSSGIGTCDPATPASGVLL